MPPGLVMSWMLDRRLSFLFMEFRRMKYFCACDATCNGGSRSDGSRSEDSAAVALMNVQHYLLQTIAISAAVSDAW